MSVRKRKSSAQKKDRAFSDLIDLETTPLVATATILEVSDDDSKTSSAQEDKVIIYSGRICG